MKRENNFIYLIPITNNIIIPSICQIYSIKIKLMQQLLNVGLYL